MDRVELLKEINKILVEENAKPIKEDDLLISSELDSFGYAILFTELNEKYNCFGKNFQIGRKFEDGEDIDYAVYKAKDLIDRIIQCS